MFLPSSKTTEISAMKRAYFSSNGLPCGHLVLSSTNFPGSGPPLHEIVFSSRWKGLVRLAQSLFREGWLRFPFTSPTCKSRVCKCGFKFKILKLPCNLKKGRRFTPQRHPHNHKTHLEAHVAAMNVQDDLSDASPPRASSVEGQAENYVFSLCERDVQYCSREAESEKNCKSVGFPLHWILCSKLPPNSINVCQVVIVIFFFNCRHFGSKVCNIVNIFFKKSKNILVQWPSTLAQY